MTDLTERVHLVGSVPLAGPEEVFRTCAAALGDCLTRMPDGETDDRRYFIDWHVGVIAGAREHLEWVSPSPEKRPQLPGFRLRRGANPDDIAFGPFGYSRWAQQSYEIFSRLRSEGVISDDTRLQISIPTPLTPVSVFFEDEATRNAVEPAYERGILAEIEAIFDVLPAEDVALQYDMCAEVAVWESHRTPHWDGDPHDGVIERAVRFASAVPEDADLGLHLCYGDYQHKHFLEPQSLGPLTSLANRLGEAIPRPITYLHMPVPRDRDDPGYFEPLSRLDAGDRTELYLGLVHYTDGVDGTLRRIDAAQETVQSFGISTECGFGRRAADTIHRLLDIHREVVEAITGHRAYR